LAHFQKKHDSWSFRCCFITMLFPRTSMYGALKYVYGGGCHFYWVSKLCPDLFFKRCYLL
jgi:hypothetical protein